MHLLVILPSCCTSKNLFESILLIKIGIILQGTKRGILRIIHCLHLCIKLRSIPPFWNLFSICVGSDITLSHQLRQDLNPDCLMGVILYKGFYFVKKKYFQ